MTILFTIMSVISIANACWIAILAAYRPAEYVRLISRSRESGTAGRLAILRVCWAFATVVAILVPGLSIALTFAPFDIGRWGQGQFGPVVDGLVSVLAFSIAYFLCSIVDLAGFREVAIEVAIEDLLRAHGLDEKT